MRLIRKELNRGILRMKSTFKKNNFVMQIIKNAKKKYPDIINNSY